jgi:choline-sulfatase
MSKKSKNVLLLMSDQHLVTASGAYGSDLVQTPALDRLAARGVRFDSAYCNSPICVPSRAALATGRYVHDTGNWDNAAPYLGTEASSWGHRVTGAGHRAVTFGKLHYRSTDDPTGFPDQRLPLHVRNGVGDLTHVLRKDQPQLTVLREAVLRAREGESTYTRFDRDVAAAAADWLTTEAPAGSAPWVCKVSFVTPHYPLVAPAEHLRRYPLDRLPMPVRHDPGEWDRHPALERARWFRGFADPLGEEATRAAMQAYFGLVSFMDEQLGIVLDALEASGQADDTVVLYVSDHGELCGTDGLWFKGTMQEPSVRIPMVLAGPGVRAGGACSTAVSLVDVVPTIVDALGIEPVPEDADLPGRSLLAVAAEPDDGERVAFSEYHSANSITGTFMVRFGRWKYVYHCDLPPQLFDVVADPTEARDLAGDPAHAETLARAHATLLDVCDPHEVDERVRQDQRRRIDDAGGVEAVTASPVMAYSPVPSA